MKLGIIGSRTFTDYDLFLSVVSRLVEGWSRIDEIVSGGANGADSLASRYAGYFGIKMTVIKPDWKTHGRAAGFLRNTQIVEQSDMIVAFWDGKSAGTKDSIDKAKVLKRPTLIVYV